MTREEVSSVAASWAAKEGWNPGLYDADTFFATDPDGFFIGLIGDEPAACISVVAYDDHFGFLGFYIVKEKFRGLGYGLRIWNHGMAYLGSRNIGLDGVVAQQENYKKSGFVFSYNNIRYEGIAKKFGAEAGFIRTSGDVSFDQVLAYDNRYFPTRRERFLHHWLDAPERFIRFAVDGDTLKGYGVIRKCLRGYKIGPLFAESPEYANGLFQALVTCVKEGEPVFLDIPDPNPHTGALVEKYRMQKVFETARMYTQKAPDLNLMHIFGVTTFELG